MPRRTKENWSMSDWRDYYEALRVKAWRMHQETGESRYDREEWKYSKIVDAFNGYLENKSETDTERIRRKRNINAYADRYVSSRETYSKNEVLKMLRDISTF